MATTTPAPPSAAPSAPQPLSPLTPPGAAVDVDAAIDVDAAAGADAGAADGADGAVDVGKDRVLQIPPPPGRREKVVKDAADALATKYAGEVINAEETIEQFGITIEVTKLRDRLQRSASTDLQRLLLATAGVPELLFNEAIAQQLAEEEQLSTPVKDESVVSIATRIESASTTIEQALTAINKSTEQFQESTKSIVEALGKVAEAIDDDKEYPTVAGADGDPVSPQRRTSGSRRTPTPKAAPKGGSGS
jgi:hypothetical protein